MQSQKGVPIERWGAGSIRSLCEAFFASLCECSSVHYLESDSDVLTITVIWQVASPVALPSLHFRRGVCVNNLVSFVVSGPQVVRWGLGVLKADLEGGIGGPKLTATRGGSKDPGLESDDSSALSEEHTHASAKGWRNQAPKTVKVHFTRVGGWEDTTTTTVLPFAAKHVRTHKRPVFRHSVVYSSYQVLSPEPRSSQSLEVWWSRLKKPLRLGLCRQSLGAQLENRRLCFVDAQSSARRFPWQAAAPDTQAELRAEDTDINFHVSCCSSWPAGPP